MDRLDLERRLDALASLAAPVRLAPYRCVAGREQGLGRDEAAAAVGISRKLAAYHLDKLAEVGLLEVRFERRSGRSGPGAGRPAKIYLRSARPLEVTLPARNYALIAQLLADAVQVDPSGAARAGLERAARAAGAENAVHADEDHSRPRDAADVHAALARHGYEPYDDEGVTRLRNCPFQRLAQTHRELVCRANLAFVEGLVQGLRARGLRAVLDPRPGRCCVALSQRSSLVPVTWQQAEVEEASEGGTVRYREANPFQRFMRWSAATAPVSWLYVRVLHHIDRLIYRLTRGRRTFVNWVSGLPVVMLTTTGAKTGQQRVWPVLGVPDGDNLVVMASNWGQRHHPAWYYNLRAHPTATATVGGVLRRVRAHEASGDERERLWRRGLEVYPGYAAYERRAANRRIPVVVLASVSDKPA